MSLSVAIDHERGLLVVSRVIVSHRLCNIFVVIADSIMVSGKVKEMHPTENYAIIQYDPELVQASVKSARLSENLIKTGVSTYFVSPTSLIA